MLNFKNELDKLLIRKKGDALTDEAAILAEEGRRLLLSFGKQQADLSMQVEEIYDLVNEAGNDKQALRDERKTVNRMINALIAAADITEDFCAFAAQSGDASLAEQAEAMRRNTDRILNNCEITRIGKAGQPLDTEIHTVITSAASPYPKEYAAQILKSGYRYKGALLRKASIAVSLGEDIING